MSNNYSISEINKIHNLESFLLTNPNVPEQLMINLYKEVQDLRNQLRNRLKVLRSQSVISHDIRKALVLEEKQEFIKFLCRLIKRYEIREHNMTRFIDDMLLTFDDLDKNMDNLLLKQSTLDYMLQNQKLNPEQITALAREKQDIDDFIIELNNPNFVIA